MIVAGCSSGEGDSVLVGAASSLSEVMPALAEDYREAGGDADVAFVFSGSQLLAAQAREAAPFALLITADRRTIERVYAAGDLVSAPVRLAGNTLTIAVAAGNPLGIAGPEDLLAPGIIVVVADAEVPAGGYTSEALERAGLELEPASREPSVRSVLAKVQAGEADAGIVYQTDVRAANGVEAVSGLPPVITEYVAAPLDAADATISFLNYLQSERAGAIFAELGFAP